MFTLFLLVLSVLCALVLASYAYAAPPKESVRFMRHKGFRRNWRKVPFPSFGLNRLMEWLPGRRPRVHFANIAEGTHHGSLTKMADGALATRYIIVKTGSDADHVAACDATSIPTGIASDNAEAAGDVVAIDLLGGQKGSLLVALGGTVAKDDLLVSNASGLAIKLPTTAGVYYVIGRAMQAGVSTETIEFDPEVHKTLVAAQWNVTTANDVIGALAVSNPPTQAEMQALRNKVETINDDMLALKAVLNTAGITKD